MTVLRHTALSPRHVMEVLPLPSPWFFNDSGRMSGPRVSHVGQRLRPAAWGGDDTSRRHCSSSLLREEDSFQTAATKTPSRPNGLSPPANKQVQKANSPVGSINKILGHNKCHVSQRLLRPGLSFPPLIWLIFQNHLQQTIIPKQGVGGFNGTPLKLRVWVIVQLIDRMHLSTV